MAREKNVKLTGLQQAYLNSLNMGDIIKDIRLLKKFGRSGMLELHEQTGSQVYVGWAQCYTKCYYIYDCKGFEINGFSFGEKYFDGCFMPFLVLTAKN